MATTILSFSSKSAGGRRPCLDRRASNHRLQPHDEGGTRNSNLTIHSEDTYMNDYFNLRFRIANIKHQNAGYKNTDQNEFLFPFGSDNNLSWVTLIIVYMKWRY